MVFLTYVWALREEPRTRTQHNPYRPRDHNVSITSTPAQQQSTSPCASSKSAHKPMRARTSVRTPTHKMHAQQAQSSTYKHTRTHIHVQASKHAQYHTHTKITLDVQASLYIINQTSKHCFTSHLASIITPLRAGLQGISDPVEKVTPGTKHSYIYGCFCTTKRGDELPIIGRSSNNASYGCQIKPDSCLTSTR